MKDLMSTPINSSTIFDHQTIRAGDCLVAMIVREVMLDQSSLTTTHAVLPNQRLHLYVSRELCRLQNNATLLPNLWTWDSLVQELTAEYVDNNLVMVSSQCELIMQFVLEQREKAHTSSPRSNNDLNTNVRHAHELVYFAAELAKAGLSQVAKQKLYDYIDRDWRRSEDVARAITERVSDVFGALEDFDKRLDTLHWTTPEKSRSGAVSRWLEASTPDKWTTIPRGRVIIAGLTSLPLLETKLLGEISRHETVSVWLDESPPFEVSSPIIELRRIVGLPAAAASEATWAKGVRSIVRSFDITHEVAHSLSRVKELIASGVAAHEIAIIVPDESSHGPAFAALANSLGIPVNIPLATPWGTTLVGRWMSLVTEVGRGFHIHNLGQYLLHPLTRILFDADLKFVETELQRQLKNFPEVDRDPAPMLAFIERKFSADDAAYMRKAILWCDQTTEPNILAAAGELNRMLQKLSQSPVTTKTLHESKSKEQASWKILRESIAQVCALEPLRGYKARDWKDLLRDIYRTASQQTVRDTGEPLNGLQIIGLTEARYVPFAAVLIVGCVEGSFPHALPKDSLLDNTMKRVIGLPGWTELEALEDTTFHLLTSRLPHVELSYPHTDADSPKIRSRWIEQLAPRIPVHELEGARVYKLFPCNKGLPCSSADENHNEGFAPDHVELTKTSSASRLRNLIWCPYRYLMDERKVKSVELPEDRENLTIGNLLHKVVEAFFNPSPSVVVATVEQDLQLAACPADALLFRSWAERRLDALAKIIIPASYARTPQFQHMTGRGWGQVADFWGKLFEMGFHPNNVGSEVNIGKSGSLKIMISDREIEINGSIDAVHSGAGATILIDYKTSFTPASVDVARGLEPQLILYAFALATTLDPALIRYKTNLDHSVAAYFSLSEGEPQYVSLGAEARNTLINHNMISKQSRASTLEDAFGAVTSRWQQRLEEISKSSHFNADPSDCGFCGFAGICRKDDPRYRDKIAGQRVARPPSSAALPPTDVDDSGESEEP
jgi:RecB family exonuclease